MEETIVSEDPLRGSFAATAKRLSDPTLDLVVVVDGGVVQAVLSRDRQFRYGILDWDDLGGWGADSQVDALGVLVDTRFPCVGEEG